MIIVITHTMDKKYNIYINASVNKYGDKFVDNTDFGRCDTYGK